MHHLGPPSDAANLRRRPLFGLSVLAAFLISFAEIAVRLATSREAFSFRQICLAVSSNFALLGLLALLIRFALLPVTHSFLRGTKSTELRRWTYFGCAALVSGLLLVATDGIAIAPKGSGIFAIAAIVLSAACLAVVLDLASRAALVRRVTIVAWLVCTAGCVYAGFSTWRHLLPWVRGTIDSTAAVSSPPNVMVIVLDTLRFDRVGAYGTSKLTPNLDRLASDSIVYTQAMSTAPWTLPMHASLFTGLYPREHGVSWGNYELDAGHPVIAELLKERGYSTFAISNNWLLNRANGFARGFDDFLETANDSQISGWRFAASTALARALLGLFNIPPQLGEDAGSAWTNWLMARRLLIESQRPGPFFGFINYFEAHDPYHPPASFLESHLSEAQRVAYRQFRQRQEDLCAQACGRKDTFTPSQIELMAALYDAEVAYQDAMVGELLTSLKNLDLLKDTWIVVTSDHGELFGESDMVFHTAGAHYQLLHVPLIVRPPGGIAVRVIETPVQPVDIFHKLVEIGGAAIPEGVQRAFPLPLDDSMSPQRNLCISETFGASITGLYVTQYRNMQTDVTQWLRWITSAYTDGYLLELDDRGPMNLYDVRTDPQMKHNLIEARKELVEEYLSRFRNWSGKGSMGGSS